MPAPETYMDPTFSANVDSILVVVSPDMRRMEHAPNEIKGGADIALNAKGLIGWSCISLDTPSDLQTVVETVGAPPSYVLTVDLDLTYVNTTVDDYNTWIFGDKGTAEKRYIKGALFVGGLRVYATGREIWRYKIKASDPVNVVERLLTQLEADLDSNAKR